MCLSSRSTKLNKEREEVCVYRRFATQARRKLKEFEGARRGDFNVEFPNTQKVANLNLLILLFIKKLYFSVQYACIKQALIEF